MGQIKETSLKFSESPLCPIAADVISGGESTCFYMYNLDLENERLIARSACWMKNLVEAPLTPQKDKIEENHQPVLPSMFVDEDMDIKPWSETELEIAWSREGHTASLLHSDEIVYVISPWADGRNFPGYALYTKENNMVVWKLKDVNPMVERILEGRAFWKWKFSEMWKTYDTPHFSQLSDLFGAATNCYDLNKDRFPSRLLLTFEKDGMSYAFAIGAGMFSMSNVDRCYAEYGDYARCEYVVQYPSSLLGREEEMGLFSSTAGLCSLPWYVIDYVGHGHTLGTPIKDKCSCVLTNDEKSGDPLPLHLKEEGVYVYRIHSVEDEVPAQLKDEEKKERLLEQLYLHTELL